MLSKIFVGIGQKLRICVMFKHIYPLAFTFSFVLPHRVLLALDLSGKPVFQYEEFGELKKTGQNLIHFKLSKEVFVKKK